MRKYLKTKTEWEIKKAMSEKVKTFWGCIVRLKKPVIILTSIAGLSILVFNYTSNKFLDFSLESVDSKFYSVTPALAATSTKRGVITIPTNTIKANPFLPYRNIDGNSSDLDIPDYDIVPPPVTTNGNPDAARVMDTIVSGILYDRYSPSAIINIEGNDYLVKKGDVVNGYKVLNILRDSVSVQLGSNVYKAGIGEILTEGEINHNDISNLNNKFGGIR